MIFHLLHLGKHSYFGTRKGRQGSFQKPFCCPETLQPEHECFPNWRGHLLALHGGGMWRCRKWLHPSHPSPQPRPSYCSELSLEPSDAWTFTSSMGLGSIQAGCCSLSSFSNRGPWVLFICIPQRSVLPCCWELLRCLIQPHAFMLTTYAASKETPSKGGPKQVIMKNLAMVLQD